jgi:tape measure domain-containing protein
MGDGIQYVYEISDKISSSVISKLEAADKASTKVEASSKGAASGHDKHAKAADHLGGALHRLTHQAMHPFLEKAKQIAEFEFIRKGVDALIEAPGEIIEKLKELGEEMILTAAKAERLDLSFKLTLGQEGAEEVLGWIEKISSKTEFTDDQLKGWSSELLRAGVKMQDVDKFLAAGLDTAAKSTDKMAGMSAAISALTRAQLTGRVESRALRGLSIGVEELKTLPQFKGLTDKQLHKKMEEGSISKDDLLTLIAGPNGVLGDLGVTAGKTFEAQLKNVKEIPEQIFQGLYKTAGFQELGSFLGRIYENFGPETEAGSRVAEQLAAALDLVAGKLQEIDLDAVAKGVGDALDQLPEALETVRSLFNDIAGVLGVFGKAIQFVTDLLPGSHESADDKLEFKLAHKEDDIVQRMLKDELKTKRSKLAAGVVEYGPHEDPQIRLKRLHELARAEIEEGKKNQLVAGKYLGDGLYEGVKQGQPKSEAAGVKIAQVATGATKKEFGVQSPSKVFADIGRQTVAGFVEGVEGSSAQIDDVIAGAFAVPAPHGGRFAAMGGGPIVVTIGDINVNAPHAVAPTETAEAVRAAVRDTLIDELERLRSEMGA